MNSVSPTSSNYAQADRVAPFMATDSATPPVKVDVSIAGVLLLSAVAVTLAILGALMLGVIVLGLWWVVVHIPVPPIVWHLLAALHLI